MTAIISVKLTDCQFESQTKVKLGNPEIKPFVESIVSEKLMNYLEENPAVARAIFDKSLAAQRAGRLPKRREKLPGGKPLWKAQACRESWRTAPSGILK